MRQPQRDDDSLWSRPSEPVGEMPEKDIEAEVDPDQARDREMHGERVRPPDKTRDEHRRDAGPGRDRCREPAVENGDARGLDRRPLDPERDCIARRRRVSWLTDGLWEGLAVRSRGHVTKGAGVASSR
jgi:hypothetical protein